MRRHGDLWKQEVVDVIHVRDDMTTCMRVVAMGKERRVHGMGINADF